MAAPSLLARSALLPLCVIAGCVVTVDKGDSGQRRTLADEYPTITINGASTSSAANQPDINIKQRGWEETVADLGLVAYGGGRDAKAPRIDSIFAGQLPAMTRAYKVGVFGGKALGFEGHYPVHVIEFSTQPGAAISTPTSGYSIGEGAGAMVLYADSDSLTIKYTREDSMATGYGVHLLGLQVSGALIETYQACLDQGRHMLPALRTGARVGTATSSLKIAVRDTGMFMDPRGVDWYDGSAAPAATPAAPLPEETPSLPDDPPPSSTDSCHPGDSGCCPPNAACCNRGIQFFIDGDATCGAVSVSVRARDPLTWVILGVQPEGESIAWRGNVGKVSCGGGFCQWTYYATQLPCGPHTLHFMADAVNDDPGQRQPLASCTP